MSSEISLRANNLPAVRDNSKELKERFEKDALVFVNQIYTYVHVEQV